MAAVAVNPYTGNGGMSRSRNIAEEMAQVEQIQLFYQPGTSPDRGIRPEIAAYFGVRISPAGDRVFYPVSTKESGEVTGYKVRILPKQFLTIGDCGSFGKNGEPAYPFGWYAATHSNSPRLIIVEGEEDCYPGTTEVLTPMGWKRFDALDGSELVAQWDKGKVSFVKPEKFIKKTSETLVQYRVKSGRTLTTTENHRMVATSKDMQRVKYFPAKDKPPHDMYCPLTGVLDSGGIAMSDWQIRLNVAVQADGTIRDNGLVLIAVYKERKILRLREILRECGLPFREYPTTREGGRYFSFHLPPWGFGKVFPAELCLSMSLHQKMVMIDELAMWDGTTTSGHDRIEYSTTCKENAEVIQALAHTCGYSTTWYVQTPRSRNHAPQYRLGINKTVTSFSWQGRNRGKEFLHGNFDVYCVRVPSSAILVREKGTVFVCGNCLAAFQAIWDYQAGTEYQGKAPAIIAVPAGNLAHIKRVVDKLDRFREIVVCMDSDEAGQKGKENLLKVLPADKVKVVDIPMKDASEMLVAGKGRELAEHLLFRGQEYKPDALLTVGEIMEDVLTPPEYGWDFPWKPLTEMTFGIRRGLGYAIGAGVAAGKTHLCHEIAVHLIRQGCTVACLMLEETAAEAVKGMAGLLAGKVFNRPGIPVDAEELRAAADELGKSLILAKDGKVQDVDEALQWVRYAVMLHGADVVIIDPMSALVDHLPASDANTAINKLCGEMEILAQEMGFAWIITSHLNPPKYGPPHEAGGRVSLRDFTGSRGLMRKASFAFGLERNSETPDPELRMINRVSLLKSRNGNPAAPAEAWLRFNPVTGSSKETAPPAGGTLIQRDKEPSVFVGGRGGDEQSDEGVPW